MNYQLFLDDERDPPDDGKPWIIARSTTEAKIAFYNLGSPDFISFDHDLGGADTAMHFIDWMITLTLDLLDDGVRPWRIGFPKKYTIHSQNPVGAENIDARMKRFIHHLGTI